jgi:hypothetical protein
MARDADLGATILQDFARARKRRLLDSDRNIRIKKRILCERVPQDLTREDYVDCKRDLAFRARVEARAESFHMGRLSNEFPGTGEDHLPHSRQRGAPSFDSEKVLTEAFFHLVDGVADGGLCLVQPFGSLMEATVLGRGDEHSPLL